MTKRIQRALLLVSLGGMTFAWGLPNAGCYQFVGNAPYTQFLTDIGNFAVGVGVDAAFTQLNPPENLTNWLQDPVTSLYQDVWTTYVRSNIAQDPTYSRLLVD